MPRAGNSVATKQAIVDAARRCFAESAYDQVGLRDIAARAGVDKRLLTRHFGAKANLFAEALESARVNLPELAQGEGDPISTNLRFVFEPGRMQFEERNDYLSLCLQSANSPEAKAVVRRALEEDVRRHSHAVSGEEQLIRAAMVLSVLFGVTFIREIVQTDPLHDADANTMIRYTAPILRFLFEGVAVAKGDGA